MDALLTMAFKRIQKIVKYPNDRTACLQSTTMLALAIIILSVITFFAAATEFRLHYSEVNKLSSVDMDVWHLVSQKNKAKSGSKLPLQVKSEHDGRVVAWVEYPIEKNVIFVFISESIYKKWS